MWRLRHTLSSTAGPSSSSASFLLHPSSAVRLTSIAPPPYRSRVRTRCVSGIVRYRDGDGSSTLTSILVPHQSFHTRTACCTTSQTNAGPSQPQPSSQTIIPPPPQPSTSTSQTTPTAEEKKLQRQLKRKPPTFHVPGVVAPSTPGTPRISIEDAMKCLNVLQRNKRAFYLKCLERARTQNDLSPDTLKLCRLLLDGYGPTLNEEEYALPLELMVRINSIPPKLLLKHWSDCVKRGWFRGHFTLSYNILQFIASRGEHKLVREFMVVARAELLKDMESAIQAALPPSGDNTTSMSPRAQLDQLIAQHPIRPLSLPHSRPFLHLDRRFYHFHLEAVIALPLTSAIRVIFEDMAYAAKLIQLVPTTAPPLTQSHRLTPADIKPSTLTYLIASRYYIKNNLQKLAIESLLHGWESAATNWSVQREVVGPCLRVIDTDVPDPLLDELSKLDERTISSIKQLDIAYLRLIRHDFTPPPLDNYHLDQQIQKRLHLFMSHRLESFNDLPTFTHIRREDIFHLHWAMLRERLREELKKEEEAKKQPSHHHEPSRPPPSPSALTVADEIAAVPPVTQSFIKLVFEYAQNPSWMQRWFIHLPVAAPSTNDTPVVGVNPMPLASGSPPAHPLNFLTTYPLANLDNFTHLLHLDGMSHTMTQFYTDIFLRYYVTKNSSVLKSAIESGLIQRLQTRSSGVAGSFTPTPRFLISFSTASPVQAVFTETDLPMQLRPLVPSLSGESLRFIFDAVLKLADTGVHHHELLRLLEQRAFQNTIAFNFPTNPHSTFGLTLPELIGVIRRLPSANSKLVQEITEHILKGILLPYLDAVEHRDQLNTSTRFDVDFDPNTMAFSLESPETRAQLQLYFSLLMRHFFERRQWKPLIGLYEQEHSRQFDPPLPLNVSQSLYVIQGSSWNGNVSGSLSLFHEFFTQYSPSQKVTASAFMAHFLETHIMKSMKQSKRKKENPFESLRQATPSSESAPTTPAVAARGSLPTPTQVPIEAMSQMGLPILSPNGGPAYQTQSGFSQLHGDDHETIQIKLNQIRSEMKHILATETTKPTSGDSSTPFHDLLDDCEFLHTLSLGKIGSKPTNESIPTLSFGMGSPAFSSYATQTATLPVEGELLLDPLSKYQLTQIQRILDKLFLTPSDLFYAPSTRTCDLRSGVSYHRGRCIIYLLTLWLRSHSNQEPITILVPRTPKIVTLNNGTVVTTLAPTESTIFQSYSCEYLLAQYYPDGFETSVIQPLLDLSNFTVDPSNPSPHSSIYYETNAFGRTIAHEPYVRFTIQPQPHQPKENGANNPFKSFFDRF